MIKNTDNRFKETQDQEQTKNSVSKIQDIIADVNDINFKQIIPFNRIFKKIFIKIILKIAEIKKAYHEFDPSHYDYIRRFQINTKQNLKHNIIKKFFNKIFLFLFNDGFWQILSFLINVINFMIHVPFIIFNNVEYYYLLFLNQIYKLPILGNIFILLGAGMNLLFKPIEMFILSYTLKPLRRKFKDKLKFNFNFNVTKIKMEIYKLINFMYFVFYQKMNFLNLKNKDVHYLNAALQRPNSRILAFFTPFKSLFIIVIIVILFAVIYATVLK